ncbi:hypothetical protein [Actinocrispum wychmicini]|uniref:Dolichyl-phosphate-mannose-protein mannosyltransferase n=1 Tax=Actinocrispum wychmicini TaxID=1213861 RepID=A0A4V2S898_9PSEU|nr:hypothetical protein [Actinocrispum wychmicini]TCO63010.1 hypothetical protein EV192_1021154 [Actinocrispum wychmicini]
MPRIQSLRTASGVFATSLAVLLFRFLVPKPVGIADNGDGWRLLCRLGVNDPARLTERFVQFDYPAAPPCSSLYVTSQLWLDRAAQWLGRLFGLDSAVDLVVLGVLCCVLAALGIALTVLGLRLTTRWQVVATVLLLLVVADSAFFGYFASVLSEGAAFIGILMLVGGLLMMQRWRYFGAAVTVVGALIAINAKAQTLVILPLLILAMLLSHWAKRWVLPVAVIVTVSAGTVLTQVGGASAGSEYREANAYHAIFDSILDGSGDTRADLADLGLPASFERYVGTNFWASNSAQYDPEYQRYRDKIVTTNLIRYYVQHPGRTLAILQRGAQDQLTARPANLGSFAANAGEPPGAREYRVPVISGLAGLVAPLGLFLLVPLWGLTAWGGVRLWRRRREIAVAVFLLLGTAASQFLIAALGEGIEGVKHQTIALFCGVLAALVQTPSLVRNPDSRPSRTAGVGITASPKAYRRTTRSRRSKQPAPG